MEGEMTLHVARLPGGPTADVRARSAWTSSATRDEPSDHAASGRSRGGGPPRCSLEGGVHTARANLYDGPRSTRSAPIFDPLDDAEVLFTRADIRARGRKVNDTLRPDLVVCLHFNAEAWGDPAKPTHSSPGTTSTCSSTAATAPTRSSKRRCALRDADKITGPLRSREELAASRKRSRRRSGRPPRGCRPYHLHRVRTRSRSAPARTSGHATSWPTGFTSCPVVYCRTLCDEQPGGVRPGAGREITTARGISAASSARASCVNTPTPWRTGWRRITGRVAPSNAPRRNCRSR